MKKYVVEFIGTFFLVLAIGCAVIPPGAGALAPIAIGVTLMVMVFAGAHISGAHFNPAVTLAIWIRGKCPTVDLLPYWLAQLTAAAAAAGIVHFLKQPGSAAPFAIGIKAALLAEFLFTFALAWVVLNTGTSKGTAGNSFYGLAIGMTVTAGAFAVGVNIRRGLQSCRRRRHHADGSADLGPPLGLPRGQLRRRGRGRDDIQAGQHRGVRRLTDFNPP